jgi:hypothetical protein
VEEIIVGSEALAAGVVTRQTLRTKYVKLHYNFACYSCATDCLGPLPKSKWVSVASTRGGRSGKSAWSTTASNIGLTPSGTPKISSGWNTSLHKAGPSCESAHGSCDTTVLAS